MVVKHLAVAHVLNSPILTDVNVQPVGLEVHGAHAVGFEHAVLFREVLLCEGLAILVSSLALLIFCVDGLTPHKQAEGKSGQRTSRVRERTVSLWLSARDLPISLPIHSSLSPSFD